jgi:hypothetical protein
MPLVGHWLATKMLLVGAPVSVVFTRVALAATPQKDIKRQIPSGYVKIAIENGHL